MPRDPPKQDSCVMQPPSSYLDRLSKNTKHPSTASEQKGVTSISFSIKQTVLKHLFERLLKSGLGFDYIFFTIINPKVLGFLSGKENHTSNQNTIVVKGLLSSGRITHSNSFRLERIPGSP